MIDPIILRTRPEVLHAACARKHLRVNIDEIVALDARYLSEQLAVQQLNERRNDLSRQIAATPDKKSPEFRALIDRGRELAAQLKALESTRLSEDEWKAALHTIPNVPHDSVPDGAMPEENKVVKTWTPPIRTPAHQEDVRRLYAYEAMIKLFASYDPPLDVVELTEWARELTEGRTVRGTVRRWIYRLLS